MNQENEKEKWQIPQSAEEERADTYYRHEVAQISTMAGVGRFQNPNREEGVKEKEWWVMGWQCDREMLEKFDDEEWCQKNSNAELEIRVEDNGAHGEGIWLNIDVVNFEGERKDGPDCVAGVRLSPAQVRLVVQALRNVLAMREASSD